MRIPGFIASVLSLALAGSCSATAIPAKHAQVELLSRQTAASPGKELLLGVHFALEKGWHIYWVNPGDSGQPPAFKWQLPEGFVAGDIQWPRPERMQSSPQLADYGYHDDVLLVVPVRTPTSLGKTSGQLNFGVEAKWLICREVCLPDQAQMHLSLSTSSAAGDNPATAQLFAGADNLVPRPLPRTWKASAISRKDDFLLQIRAGKAIAKAEFFPLQPAQIDNAAPQQLQPAAQGLKIVLKKSDFLLKPIQVLRGVLVLPGGDVYRVEAPVRQE